MQLNLYASTHASLQTHNRGQVNINPPPPPQTTGPLLVKNTD